MQTRAAKSLGLLVVLPFCFQETELPFRHWEEQYSSLESIELHYEVLSSNGEITHLEFLFEAPDHCYLSAGEDFEAWIKEGESFFRMETDEGLKTGKSRNAELFEQSFEWFEAFRTQLPRDAEPTPQVAGPVFALFPHRDGRQITAQLNYLQEARVLFGSMMGFWGDEVDVDQKTDGFLVRDGDDRRILLDQDHGFLRSAWHAVAEDEDEVIRLLEASIDEQVEIPDEPDDAEDITDQFARDIWLAVRAQMYAWLWRREFIDDIALTSTDRELSVEAFAELHSKLNLGWLEFEYERQCGNVDSELAKLKDWYDSANDQPGFSEEFIRIKSHLEESLRGHLEQFEAGYSSEFGSVDVPGIELEFVESKEELIEIEREGALTLVAEAYSEPLMDRMLEGFERIY